MCRGRRTLWSWRTFQPWLLIGSAAATSPPALLEHREPVTFEVDDGDPSPSTGWTVLHGERERVDRNGRTELDPQLMPWPLWIEA
jgi:hypothetical protein